MARWTLAGLMALAALGAVAMSDVGSATADAAPSVSPFAGTFDWSGWPATITISDGGRISSSYTGFSRTKGSINGRVSDDGSYSFTVSETFGDVPERGRTIWTTSSYVSEGTMEPDADGNLVGTSAVPYRSFVWVRR